MTLKGIAKFMLFEQGDFILELIHMVSGLFEMSFQKISKSLLNSHIEEALRSCSADSLPEEMKKNLTFMYLKKSRDPSVKHLKGWTVFSILYRPEYPINCLFNDEIMHGFA
jgi:hypothetical protein